MSAPGYCASEDRPGEPQAMSTRQIRLRPIAAACRRLVGPLQRARGRRWSSAIPRRSTSTAGSPTPTSRARSRTPGCWLRSASSSPADLAAIERGLWRSPTRFARGAFRLVARSRGRAPQHRAAPDRAGRRRRQAPAHRPLAQRPGGHRPAAVAARRDRRASLRGSSRCGARCSTSPSRTPRRSCPASRICRSRSR